MHLLPQPSRSFVRSFLAVVCVATVLLQVSCRPDDSSGLPPDKTAEQPSDTSAETTEPLASAPDSHSESPPDATAHEHPANELIHETSLYLRMHAHNPVHWYPWGAAAFEKAQQEDKPIFLSVGYSSCYWCHVMERESFMDEEIANFLNEHFICIKVDREERPDVDEVYMTAVQVIARRGGWPMSVFMTPDGKPFFGGTYFPDRDRANPRMTGFLTLIRQIQTLWQTKRSEVNGTAEQVTEIVRAEMSGTGEEATPVTLDQSLVDSALADLQSVFDAEYGGFGFDLVNPQSPKFPEPSNLWLLLSEAENGSEEARQMLLLTLDHLARGGIWDHVGGGFHRYSTDRFWYIPHFEKMLYDNGQLLSIYARAFELTGDESLRRVVDQTVVYLQREMRDEQGAYYAAMDAESEQIEGKFYRWTRQEVRDTLGDQYESFAVAYGLNDEPNFEHEFHVLRLVAPLEELATQQSLSVDQFCDQLQPQLAKLLEVRNQRPRPLTDTKILCSWNGQMIRGLADAGRCCDNEAYTQLAAEAAEFVLSKLRDENGRLKRTYSQGEARLNAYLDDYAFLIDGLLALHEATEDAMWLNRATELARQQIEYYWDGEQGGFFFTSNDHEKLIVRNKQFVDGAQPSGNSISAANLLSLSRQYGQAEFAPYVEQTLQAATGVWQRAPRAAPRMTAVLGDWLRSSAVEPPDSAN